MEDLVEPIFVPRSEFWKGKKVLVTGHTGFKGSWLSIWLSRLGAEVIGISLAQVEKPNLFCEAQVEHLCSQSYFCDISDSLKFPELVRSINPDVVFHLATCAWVATALGCVRVRPCSCSCLSRRHSDDSQCAYNVVPHRDTMHLA